jgi:SAM-dependent methyltransferase
LGRRMLNAIWDDHPANYAATRDCWLTRRRLLYVGEALREASAGQRVLELGSGTGELLIGLAGQRPDLQFIGTEPQESYVEFSIAEASKRDLPNLSFRTAPADRVADLFRQDERFDWILSNDMLHHVPDEQKVLEAAAEVARPGARWLAIEPNWRNLYVLIGCAIKRGERNFWPGPFLSHGRAHGWSCVDRSFLFLLPPFVKKPHRLLIGAERALERHSLLAGGVALTLVYNLPNP